VLENRTKSGKLQVFNKIVSATTLWHCRDGMAIWGAVPGDRISL
jgi:hypothetical protein